MASKQSNSTNFWLIIGTAATAASFSVWWAWRKRQHSKGSFGTGWDVDDHNDNVNDDYSLPDGLKRAAEKERRRQAMIPLLAMKKPMYDNILMVDPQGTLLSTISKKKARWYIKKNLGSWTDKEETKLQLLFEPSHRSNQSTSKDKDKAECDDAEGNISDKGNNGSNNGAADADDDDVEFFNKSIKQNICVVCGDDKYHMRHYVVPYTCRTLFPKKYKLHMAHDVVILCPDCHLDCKKVSMKRMKYLESKCRIDPDTAISHFVDHRKYKVKSGALALLRSRDKLPTPIIEEYESLIRDNFNMAPDEELTKDRLEEAIEIETSQRNPKYITPSEIIVKSICRDETAIEAFVKGWRHHFVETMDPQYLPKGWNVDSSVESSSAERKDS